MNTKTDELVADINCAGFRIQRVIQNVRGVWTASLVLPLSDMPVGVASAPTLHGALEGALANAKLFRPALTAANMEAAQ